MIRGGGGGVPVRRHNRRKPAHSIPQAVLMHRLEVSGATVCLGEGGGRAFSVQSAAGGEIRAPKHTQPGLLTTGLRSPNVGCEEADAGSRSPPPPPSWVFVTEQRYKQSGDSETGPFSADE